MSSETQTTAANSSPESTEPSDIDHSEVDIEAAIKAQHGSLEAFLDEHPTTTAEIQALQPIRSRPKVLHGETYCIQTGYGQLYVNINVDGNGEPFEIFTNIGSSGGFTSSFTEAVSKLASLCLRAGIPPEHIAEQLTGIRSPKVQYDNGDEINSIPDGIATAIERFDSTSPYSNNALEQTSIESHTGNTDSTDESVTKSNVPEEATSHTEDGPANQEVETPDDTEPCPECNSVTIYYSEGCKTCESCGWSEC